MGKARRKSKAASSETKYNFEEWAAKRKKRKMRSNGPFDENGDGPLKSLAEDTLLPALVAYAASRLTTRIANMSINIGGAMGKRIATGGTAAALVVAAYFVGEWKKQWRAPALTGAAIAAVQTLLEQFMPMLGWIIQVPPPLSGGGARELAGVVVDDVGPSKQDAEATYEGDNVWDDLPDDRAVRAGIFTTP